MPTKKKEAMKIKGGSMGWYKILYDKKDDIIRDYQNGMSLYAIAKKYNASYCTVKRVIKKFSNEIKKTKQVGVRSSLWDKKNDVIKDYLSGETLYSVAKKYGVSHMAIKNFLVKNKVKLRMRGRRQKITKEEVLKYLDDLKSRKIFIYQLANRLGVSEVTLRRILKLL